MHRLVYLIAVPGVVHYWWLMKKDVTQPLLYAGVLALPLAVRLPWGAAGLQTLRHRFFASPVVGNTARGASAKSAPGRTAALRHGK